MEVYNRSRTTFANTTVTHPIIFIHLNYLLPSLKKMYVSAALEIDFRDDPIIFYHLITTT